MEFLELKQLAFEKNRKLKSERVELSTLKKNEQQIREAVRDFLRNPLSIRENMEKIREVLGL